MEAGPGTAGFPLSKVVPRGLGTHGAAIETGTCAPCLNHPAAAGLQTGVHGDRRRRASGHGSIRFARGRCRDVPTRTTRTRDVLVGRRGRTR